MRRSHALQLLGAIIVFLVIVLVLLFGSYAQAASNNDSVQSASILAMAALGGSFGGTTLFWLLFQCDFARRKKMRHMNERIEKLEEAQKDDATKSLETNLKEYIKKTINNAVKEIKNPKSEEAQKDDATKSLETNLKEYIKETIDNAVKKINNPKSADDKTTSSNKESKSGDNDKT